MISIPSNSPQVHTGTPSTDAQLNILASQAITPALQAILELQSLVTKLQTQVAALQKAAK